jgi:arylsulfatase A-like enzyme
MIDTLRADHLECYGFDKPTSPAIAQLADQGTLFEQVVAASPWTGPSVAAVLTGHYPDELGVRDLRAPLPDSALTLAERFKEAGYTTGAVVSNAVAGPSYNHDQGYDFFYFERYKGKKGDTEEGLVNRPVFTADRVTDQALAWLRSAQKPFFLYVHYTDPHDPYLPPLSWREPFIAGRIAPDESLLVESRFRETRPDPKTVDGIKAYYEAEIAFVDHEVGRLLKALPPDALVVLTGDHGEEFLEHGGFLHGHTLYQELLDVPLIFKGSGIRTGIRVDDRVSHVDITPTLLDLTGLPPDHGLSGKSLKPFFKDPEWRLKERPLFSVLETRTHRSVSVRQGHWKFMVVPEERKVFLYDLKDDPLEQRNVAQEHHQVVSSLLDAVRNRKHRIRPAETGSPEMERAREEELRAIGYIK